MYCNLITILYVIITTDANAIRYTNYILYSLYIITIAITNYCISIFVMVINSILLNKKVYNNLDI